MNLIQFEYHDLSALLFNLFPANLILLQFINLPLSFISILYNLIKILHWLSFSLSRSFSLSLSHSLSLSLSLTLSLLLSLSLSLSYTHTHTHMHTHAHTHTFIPQFLGQ